MVAMKIRDMKDNKSPGVDGIPPKLLLEIVVQISIPLATVFNVSLEEGIVPLKWKEANIIPLFKKGSRNKSENYRPVSLTSVICKLLERLIKDHLVDFLVKNKLINPSQHIAANIKATITYVRGTAKTATTITILLPSIYIITGRTVCICYTYIGSSPINKLLPRHPPN